MVVLGVKMMIMTEEDRSMYLSINLLDLLLLSPEQILKCYRLLNRALLFQLKINCGASHVNKNAVDVCNNLKRCMLG